MLIEWSKINFRQRDKDLSHLFVMASVKWDRDKDAPTGVVDMVGSASILKMKQSIPTTLILKKGDYIPNTRTPLQADNFGIKFNDLEGNWDTVINYITTHKPPKLDDYPNPYTGETYRTLFPKDYINNNNSDKNRIENDSLEMSKSISFLSRIKNIFRR